MVEVSSDMHAAVPSVSLASFFFSKCVCGRQTVKGTSFFVYFLSQSDKCSVQVKDLSQQ